MRSLFLSDPREDFQVTGSNYSVQAYRFNRRCLFGVRKLAFALKSGGKPPHSRGSPPPLIHLIRSD